MRPAIHNPSWRNMPTHRPRDINDHICTMWMVQDQGYGCYGSGVVPLNIWWSIHRLDFSLWPGGKRWPEPIKFHSSEFSTELCQNVGLRQLVAGARAKKGIRTCHVAVRSRREHCKMTAYISWHFLGMESTRKQWAWKSSGWWEGRKGINREGTETHSSLIYLLPSSTLRGKPRVSHLSSPLPFASLALFTFPSRPHWAWL